MSLGTCWRCGSANVELLYMFFRDYHFRMNPGFNAMAGCKRCKQSDSEQAGWYVMIHEVKE